MRRERPFSSLPTLPHSSIPPLVHKLTTFTQAIYITYDHHCCCFRNNFIVIYRQILYANEAESINPVEKEKEEQQSPEVRELKSFLDQTRTQLILLLAPCVCGRIGYKSFS